MTGIKVERSLTRSVTVITLTGELDARSSDLLHAHVATMMPAHSRVLLDLSGTEHVTSAGLRTLLLMYRQGKAQGNAVALVGVSAELRGILSATGFLDFFGVVDSASDGIDLLTRHAHPRERVDA
jgi:anti-sigma B factor antagonist